MLNYQFQINGTNFAPYVERDSYNTAMRPVYTNEVVTLDGVSHYANLRNKYEITFEMNPTTAARTAALGNALMVQPCTVYFFSLQTQSYTTATMSLDGHSADYLSRCLSQGQTWNQLAEITLTEL